MTERELAIARLVAEGKVNKEIASELRLSPATIASRLRLLYGKLGVSGRAALVHALWERSFAPVERRGICVPREVSSRR